MKVLVTGANGFVGRSLSNMLADSGQTVVAASRCTLPDSAFKISNFQVSRLAADTNWQPALQGCDAVVHLAARVHVMTDTATDPLTEFRKVNVDATLNLARQAAAAGVRRFVFISSIKVNGETMRLWRPFSEDDEPDPQDPYGISKHEAEQGLRRLAAEMGIEVVIIRPPLVYGPGVKANFLNMMRWMYKGVPLPFGAIHNHRSLVALDNLIDFIVTCLKHPAAANQTFLVSDGEDISTTDLLYRVAEAMDVPARLFPIPQKLLEVGFKVVGKDDWVQRLCGSLQVDITKAHSMLDWKPLITVDEGLSRTAEYFLRSRD